MKVVLISTYELGRQPFGLASPAAWLKDAGASVTTLDLAVQTVAEKSIEDSDLVAFYLPMHTATRIASGLIPQVKKLNPRAHVCCYGLYAPVNEDYLRRLGADTVLGGEFEEGLLALYGQLQKGCSAESETVRSLPLISLNRQRFLVPDRSGLPPIESYAALNMGPSDLRQVGYTEASRGCKHLCRHCPIVPVYNGAFRIVQRDVVLEDIRRQVAAGARHITFGDPDFFNGPGHALALVEALHKELPEVTYDVTIKVEHLYKHARHLPILRETGCAFVTSAVEAVDDRILEIFDKVHTREEFLHVVALFREVGLHLNPTFVTFTPWTTLEGYRELLELLLEQDLVDNVAPIQYAIRLLIPAGSRLLELDETQRNIAEFDEEALSYPWSHPDPRVDRLQEDVLALVQKSSSNGADRRQVFSEVWRLASEALAASADEHRKVAALMGSADRATIPYLTEPWYC